ncbi:MAG: HAD family phosphatase [Candidatus Bathyarchaeota archaeon]|nr:MAG: HAD family phosphatase [Candidatus Bathyarchaeota archaeon]
MTEASMTIKLVIFDVDGTLLQGYSWQYLHEALGTWPEAKGFRDLFFANRIAYEDWARRDALLWKNQPLTRIREIVTSMPYIEGVEPTIQTLKERGIKLYLLSAGVSFFAERINKELGCHGYTANTLLSRNGYLTGEVEVEVPFNDKVKHLPAILQRFNLTSQECAAVGDDRSLIPLFKEVALALAFNPTDKDVEDHANVTIRKKNLQEILPHILK